MLQYAARTYWGPMLVMLWTQLNNHSTARVLFIYYSTRVSLQRKLTLNKKERKKKKYRTYEAFLQLCTTTKLLKNFLVSNQHIQRELAQMQLIACVRSFLSIQFWIWNDWPLYKYMYTVSNTRMICRKLAHLSTNLVSRFVRVVSY
jgi:hypothetical protein